MRNVLHVFWCGCWCLVKSFNITNILCDKYIAHILYIFAMLYSALHHKNNNNKQYKMCDTFVQNTIPERTSHSPSTHQFECAKTQGTIYVFPHIIDTSGMICGICMYIVMRILIKQTIYIYVHINV